jgi:gamma-glutamyl:cysteine ligase YbdK (ATP-grasp superfamily)
MTLSLFQGFGVELEYMVVAEGSLDVLPIVDELFLQYAGSYVSDIERGPLSWSNELVAHVGELKTAMPVRTLDGVAAAFQRDIQELNRALAGYDARLLPTGMHPWMDPTKETRLWPHDNDVIYQAFDRIFGCSGHGWSNLQSAHLNLPFDGDAEFGKLHAAIRLILPLIPALSASTPFMDGKLGAALDQRLAVYRTNSRRIPSVCGRVIPEPVYTRATYERELLGRIYADIAPFDPEGILQDEFLNARGAIARFGRGSFELRVIDTQECPAHDLAIIALVVTTLEDLVAERWSSGREQASWPTERLADLYDRVVAEGDFAVIDDPSYLAAFGLQIEKASAAEVWHAILEQVVGAPRLAQHLPSLSILTKGGPLARRILRRTGRNPTREKLHEVYAELSESLSLGRMLTDS